MAQTCASVPYVSVAVRPFLQRAGRQRCESRALGSAQHVTQQNVSKLLKMIACGKVEPNGAAELLGTFSTRKRNAKQLEIGYQQHHRLPNPTKRYAEPGCRSARD